MFQKFKIVWMIGILLTSALVAVSSSNLMAAASGATTPKSEDSSSDGTSTFDPFKTGVNPFEALVQVTDGKGTASGVFVTPAHILTAKHAAMRLRESTVALIQDSTGEVFKIKSIMAFPRSDAAIIEVDHESKVKPAAVSCDIPTPLQVLFAVGIPMGLSPVIVPVTVAGYYENLTPMGLVRLLAVGAVTGGMSGGPVFDDTGKVVALVSMEHMDTANEMDSDINGFVPMVDVPGACEPKEVIRVEPE